MSLIQTLKGQNKVSLLYCVVPEHIHTHSKEGYWKFQGGGGSQKPEFIKESKIQNWNFLRDGEGEGGGSNKINRIFS